MYAFGKRGRPRFKPTGRFASVEGKGEAIIRSEPVPAVHWNGLVLLLRPDRKDKPASAKDLVRPHVRQGVGVGRPLKGEYQLREAVAVSRKRGPRKAGSEHTWPPALAGGGSD